MPPMIIDLAVFETIKDLQAQHGLKYESYHRYRSYCSRRLHRIRRSLNVAQGVASTSKARHSRGRKLMDISNAMVLEVGEKDLDFAVRMLTIPLWLAERAWSYAMQLKQEATEQPRKKYHLVRRLEKASQHAQRFEKLCHDPESPCTERTKLEATAYSSYITGLFNMEREMWPEAKENLDRALNVYSRLSVTKRDENVLEFYRQGIDELRASLRYCAFNLAERGAKEYGVELPATLQFHDIAFRHAAQQQEADRLKEDQAKKEQQAAKAAKQAAAAKVAAAKEVVKMDVESPKSVKPADSDDDEEFEETRDKADEENEEEEDEEEEEEEDDKQQSQASRGGGVTGLVKGWLGGAWS